MVCIDRLIEPTRPAADHQTMRHAVLPASAWSKGLDEAHIVLARLKRAQAEDIGPIDPIALRVRRDHLRRRSARERGSTAG